jgi:oligosaccharide repeat unit polymerase
MTIEFWLSVFSALFWIFSALFFARKKKDYLHPVVVFLLVFSLTYPVKLAISFMGFYRLDSMSVNSDIIFSSIVLFNVAALAFVFPMMLQKAVITDRNIFSIKSFNAYTLIIMALLLLILINGYDAITSIFSKELLQNRIIERGNERLGSGIYRIFGQLIPFFLILFTMVFFRKNKSFNLFSVITIVMFGSLSLLLVGSKYQALFLPVVMLISFYYFKRSMGCNILNSTKLIMIAVIFIVFLAIIGYVRGFGMFGGTSHPFILQSFYQLANSFDAADNLIVLLDRSNTLVEGEMGFSLIVHALVLPFIPRLLWSDKPLIQGNQFIMEKYFPEVFISHTGEAISPSFIGELLLTGGVLYMVIFLLICGYLTSKLYYKSQRYGGIWYVIYVWCLLNTFNFLRSGTGVIGSLLIFTIIILVAYKFMQILSAISHNKVRPNFRTAT